MLKKYEIIKNSIEVPYKRRKEIEEGITLTERNISNPETVGSFDTLEEAKLNFRGLKSNIKELSGPIGTYYLVEEYCIEENSYDEDMNLAESGDIWEFSKLVIKVVEKPSYNTLSTYNNMKDAVEALEDYNGDNEVFLSF